MEFLKLYDEENIGILFSMSWLNKNSNFDKSIGSFENIDLFTFLENINSFDYEKDFIYYGLHDGSIYGVVRKRSRYGRTGCRSGGIYRP